MVRAMEPSPSLQIWARAAALCAALSIPSPGRAAPPDSSATGPSVIVAVQSLTGRTAVAGRTIAAMLGGRSVRYGAPPQGMQGLPGAGLEGLPELTSIDISGAEVVYVGFPIWSERPTPDAVHVAELPALAGKRVVPFYTFLHYVRPEELSALASVLVKTGATPMPPMGIRVSLFDTEEQVVASVQEALLARPDLWGGPTTAPDRTCAPPGGAGAEHLCHVPAGPAWLGDTQPSSAPPGYLPPRLVQVPAFDIDRKEATVAELRRCTEAGACPPLRLQGFCATLVKEGGDGVPAPCLSHAQAEGYCRWRGMTLPTASQWARAARGASTWAYPWPGGFRRDGGNLGERAPFGHPAYAIPTATTDWPTDGHRGLAPPCSFPEGRSAFGLCDMAGNLAEWLAPEPGSDGQWAILAGGSWLSVDPTDVRVSSTARHPKELAFYLTGVRCAR